jgi:hypothetical protein
MNKVGRILLVVGVVVLALLVGVLIGRGHHVQSTAAAGNAAEAVQITTSAPPSAQPAPLPLPAPVQAPVQAPQTVAIPKLAPDVQVQEDAAAVGMTTREANGQDASPATAAPAPKSPAGGDAAQPQSQPQSQPPSQPQG